MTKPKHKLLFMDALKCRSLWVYIVLLTTASLVCGWYMHDTYMDWLQQTDQIVVVDLRNLQ